MSLSAWQYCVFEKVTPWVQIPPEILKFQCDTISAQASAVCQEVPMSSLLLRIRGEREGKHPVKHLKNAVQDCVCLVEDLKAPTKLLTK